ncbi:Hypothetical protein PAU_00266 [Photorhabdus asymbiotica]|uniref:Uncharacterized protein n=1 Tax=Photorhabdus asymbiotica subsp. asymbiotica (strain ATCC 43949 / 3105-77) TaxID=553480 RepID=B6VM66_PHOAA|nr:Hypothetical protein PAU_00266 [Photorhabdus asymbiotica]CAR67246.1 Hypothetical protein PA-RVA11-2301 [Photorhabdus asymbiotica subsp. asymbiotica ATCC 43949]
MITVDTIIFVYDCFADIGQIQGSHQVQTGTASRGFHYGFLAFTHPAISQFRPLSGMDAINEQDGLIVSGFLLEFPVGFYKGPLLFRVELVWHAGRFFITKSIVVQPFIHAGNGVTDIPRFFDKVDNRLCGGQKIRGQISDKFLRLCFAEVALRAAIVGLEFAVIKVIADMTINGHFMQAQGLSDHDRAPALRGQQDRFDTITLPLITAGVMKVFKFGFLFVGNEYFHDGYPEPHLGENQAVSMSTGIEHNISDSSLDIKSENEQLARLLGRNKINHNNEKYYYEYSQQFDIKNDYPVWNWVNSYQFSKENNVIDSLPEKYQSALISAYKEYWALLKSKDLKGLKQLHKEFLDESVRANGGNNDDYFSSIGLDEIIDSSDLKLLPLDFSQSKIDISLDGRVAFMSPSPLVFINKNNSKNKTLLNPKYRFDGNKFILTR